MERIAVASSNVAEIGYDPEKKTLEVMFHGGGVYQYHDVPETVHHDLMEADSKGRFLSAIVKGFYRCERVE